jgi:hypothetical protein
MLRLHGMPPGASRAALARAIGATDYGRSYVATQGGNSRSPSDVLMDMIDGYPADRVGDAAADLLRVCQLLQPAGAAHPVFTKLADTLLTHAAPEAPGLLAASALEFLEDGDRALIDRLVVTAPHSVVATIAAAGPARLGRFWTPTLWLSLHALAPEASKSALLAGLPANASDSPEIMQIVHVALKSLDPVTVNTASRLLPLAGLTFDECVEAIWLLLSGKRAAGEVVDTRSLQLALCGIGAAPRVGDACDTWDMTNRTRRTAVIELLVDHLLVRAVFTRNPPSDAIETAALTLLRRPGAGSRWLGLALVSHTTHVAVPGASTRILRMPAVRPALVAAFELALYR